MKKWLMILFTILFCRMVSADLGYPYPLLNYGNGSFGYLYVTNLTVYGMINGLSITNWMLNIHDVDETGTVLQSFMNVLNLEFDSDSGLHTTSPAPGTVRVSLGSHFYGWATDDGATNYPTGAQNIRFLSDTNATETSIDTSTVPWTLRLPYWNGSSLTFMTDELTNSDVGILDFEAGTNIVLEHTSPTSGTSHLKISASSSIAGPRGFPGFSFGVFAGSWATNENYTTNEWLNYNGAVYGVMWTNWVPGSGVPTDYLASGKLILLSPRATDGANGANGSGLTMYGDWSAVTPYTNNAMVRHGSATYYTLVPSVGQDPHTYTNVWSIFTQDGSSGASGLITSNVVWGSQFDYTATYESNTIVYWAAYPYGVYLVRSNCTAVDYQGATYGIASLEQHPEYFVKIAHYARDGSNGSNGSNGGTGPAGAGNMWFQTNGWSALTSFTNAGQVVIYNDETFISIAPSLNIAPGVHPSWQSYWIKAAGKGADGGTYVFSLNWDDTHEYTPNDVVIATNIFYLCVAGGNVGTAPWVAQGTNYWSRLIDPAYRNYGLMPSRAWVSGMDCVSNELLRYSGSTYVALYDVTNSTATPAANTNQFAVVAEKGATGATGATGVPGTTTTIYTNMVVSTQYLVDAYFTNYFGTQVVWQVTNTYWVTNTYETNVINNYTNTYNETNTYNIYSTNTYGTDAGSAYRGDWGDAVSNKMFTTNGGAINGWISLSGTTNQLTDDGTNLLRNGAPITGGSSSETSTLASVTARGSTSETAPTINVQSEYGELVIGSTGRAVRIGRNTGPHTGANDSIAIGNSATATTYCIAIGTGANAYAPNVSSIAIGNKAYATDGAISIGPNAGQGSPGDINIGNSASGGGITIGYQAVGGAYNAVALGFRANAAVGGVAVGQSANAAGGGTAIGAQVTAYNGAVGLGYYSVGSNSAIVLSPYGGLANWTNIVIGYKATASTPYNKIAIGNGITNEITESIAVRGTLYLDGGTGTFVRATFGAGAWYGTYSDGTNLFFVNSTGAVEKITNL